jgi:hypothetical protein
MSAIRGEKIRFRKKDIVALHDLPSARTKDPMIVHCPPARSRTRRTAGYGWRLPGRSAFHHRRHHFHHRKRHFRRAAVTAGAVGVELGDRTALPRRSRFDGFRFTSNMRLALEARNVNLIDEKERSAPVDDGLDADGARPAAAVSRANRDRPGRGAGHRARYGAAAFRQAAEAGRPEDRRDPGCDGSAFDQLDILDGFVDRGGTKSIKLEGIDIKLADTANGPLSIVVEKSGVFQERPNALQLDGEIAINGEKTTLSVVDGQVGGRTSRLTGSCSTPIWRRSRSSATRSARSGRVWTGWPT